MSDKPHLDDIENLVNECIKNDKILFLSNLIYTLQQNYKELAMLCTDGEYHSDWSHIQVMDHLTYEN